MPINQFVGEDQDFFRVPWLETAVFVAIAVVAYIVNPSAVVVLVHCWGAVTLKRKIVGDIARSNNTRRHHGMSQWRAVVSCCCNVALPPILVRSNWASLVIP
jgi:hypothetical protein